eukprot:2178207-Pyramimonas_sp.AAC.1
MSGASVGVLCAPSASGRSNISAPPVACDGGGVGGTWANAGRGTGAGATTAGRGNGAGAGEFRALATHWRSRRKHPSKSAGTRV